MPRGSVDSDRPRRIALATLEVVAQRGVEGLTHRAVAAAADVPLGSTTYHFRTLDDLLTAAILEAKRATDAYLADWAANVRPTDDLARSLARYLFDTLDTRHDRMVIELELYIAALRRPALQKIAIEWDTTLPDTLARFVDRPTARLLGLIGDALLIQATVHGAPPPVTEIESMLRRVLH